jgi:hypothetical protein
MKLTKKCGKCQEIKPYDCFYNVKSAKTGKASSCKACQKEWEQRNRNIRKAYPSSALDRQSAAMKRYRNKNKEIVKLDPFHVTKNRLRLNILRHLKRKRIGKPRKTLELLGAPYDTVIAHLKLTWFLNYGSIYIGGPVHIDHIKPLSLAKTKEELIELLHYKNLQYLKPVENVQKSNRLDVITPYMAFVS